MKLCEADVLTPDGESRSPRMLVKPVKTVPIVLNDSGTASSTPTSRTIVPGPDAEEALAALQLGRGGEIDLLPVSLDHDRDLLAAALLDGRLEVVPPGERHPVDRDDLVTGREPGLARRTVGRDALDRRVRPVVDATLPGDHHEEEHEGDDQVDGDAGEDHRQATAGVPWRKVRGSSSGSTSSRLVMPMMRT